MFGKGTRFDEQVPAFELCGNGEEVVGRFGVTVDVGRLESFDGVGGSLLAGAKFGEPDHPGWVFIG